jgi:hypothetical protein
MRMQNGYPCFPKTPEDLALRLDPQDVLTAVLHNVQVEPRTFVRRTCAIASLYTDESARVTDYLNEIS